VRNESYSGDIAKEQEKGRKTKAREGSEGKKEKKTTMQ